jgi:CheY-like chemotaxis protein
MLPLQDYESAASSAQNQRFDAIFVGMCSPDQGEAEIVGRIRASEPNRKSVIVAVSANEDVPALRKAFAQGADLFLVKPVPGDRLRRILAGFAEWKDNRYAARLPFLSEILCSSNGRQFQLHSMNISETGMLCKPAPDLEIGADVALEFKIKELRASLSVFARIVRKEANENVGFEFVGLAPEDINAIHIYVTGRFKDVTERENRLAGIGLRRLFPS